VSLIGISYIENVNAASGHDFESQWGKAGIGKSGFFLSPQHLAFDSENNVYVTDLGNSRIQKFDSTGNFLTDWGSRGTNSAEFGHPTGIAISDEFVFVVDSKNHNIQKFTLDGEFISKWGGFGKDIALFKSPRGITISDDNLVYIVDSGNTRIQKFTLDGEYVSHFGQSGLSVGNFVTPVDIAINSDKIYVTDSNQNKIVVFDLEGNFKKVINDSVGGYSVYPEGIIFDKENNFYIVDYRNNRIIHYNEFGTVLAIFGQMGNENGNFKFPKDVAISNDGYLFVTDTQGHRIQKFSTPLVQNFIIIEEEQTLQSEINSQPEKIETIKSPLQPLRPVPNDFQKPIIMVPEDILVEASGSLTSINIGEAMATDESGIFSLSNNAPSLFPLGINTIIWTAVDGAGNMAIASQTVTIQDSTPPKISPIEDISLEARSSTQNLVTLVTPDISDEVGVMYITNDAPTVFPLGETIVTWTATDVIGNVSTLSQSIRLIDSSAPRIAFSEDLIIEASSLDQNKVELDIPETSDDIEIISITNDAPDVFPLGETIVTWTATDSSGNSSSQSNTIIFIDSVTPEIFISDQTFEAIMSGGTNMSLVLPEIVDIQDTTLTNDAPDVFPFGETIVTWTATDSSGNSASATQTITVVDTTSPVLIAPENLIIEAENILTEIENFGEIVAEDISGITTITNDAPTVFPLGETIVTWTATDDYDNTISNIQIITILDTILPEIMAPSDLQIEASHIENNVIDLIGVRASDQVEISTITNDAPTVFPLGETIVTWTATDSSGNSASATQQILVMDTTSPSITVPSDIEVEIYDKLGMEIDTGIAISDDIVDSQPIITNDAPTVFPLGETIVTWTATDSSGNSASATQTITVVDTTLPTIMVPVNMEFEATSMKNNLVEFGFAEASDQVEISTITNDASTVFPLGETIVTWTATDSSGNSASATQTITVVDTTLPTITVPVNMEFEATSMKNNLVEFGFAEASDQVEISTITNDAPTVFPLGETIVTWTATDSSGNSASATQTITVVDTTAPVMFNPENIISNATSKLNNNVTLDQISVIDSISIVQITNNAPLYYEFGETIVTWTATDSSGNSASATQTITVVDTTAPIITTPQDVIVDAVNTETFLEIGLASANDIIDDTPIITNDAPTVFPLGETIVTWTATDKFGNISSSLQTISVQTCGNDPLSYNMIVGSEDDDILIGTTLSDLIFANGGDDIISGDKGNDCIIAGDGDDIIFGNEGNDNISGQGGNDIIKGQSGQDFIFGGFGLDLIDGGEDIDICKIIDEQNYDIVIKCELNE
jgi:large repetitive protein